jgi:hypothetical protein
MNQAPSYNPQNKSLVDRGIASITNAAESVKQNVQGAFNGFSNQPNTPSSFSFSNTIIAKFAFVVFVIIIFMFLINLGINLIMYFSSASTTPYLVKGMLDGANPLTISQDPNASDSVTILRSNNESLGAEFTWAVWINITDIPSTQRDQTAYQHIFNKGNNTYGTDHIATVNNGPGLYLGNLTDPEQWNNFHIIMDTVSPNDPNITIDIPDIPLKNWVFLVIRLENSILDVYVNGTISARLTLSNVPKQNYDNVYLFQNGGFNGAISNLRYYNYALNVFEINSILQKGPNTTKSSKNTGMSTMSTYTYLSYLWYDSKL